MDILAIDEDDIREWLGCEPTLENFMSVAKFRFIPDVHDCIVKVQIRDGTTVWGGGEVTYQRGHPLETAKYLARKCISQGVVPFGNAHIDLPGSPEEETKEYNFSPITNAIGRVLRDTYDGEGHQLVEISIHELTDRAHAMLDDVDAVSTSGALFKLRDQELADYLGDGTFLIYPKIQDADFPIPEET